MRARAIVAPLVALVACLATHAAPVRAQETEQPNRLAFDDAAVFVTQPPHRGFSIDGGTPVLLVNVSSADRQVVVAWKRPLRDLLTLSHAVAAGRQDSCIVEWTLADGRRGSESWWLDRTWGLLVSRDAASWLARARGQRTWSFRCPALGVKKVGGEYDLAALEQSLADPSSAGVMNLAPDEFDPSRDSLVAPPDDHVYVEELPEAISKVACDEPAAARDQGMEGTVVVRALVDTTGAIAEVTVVKSVPLLDATAIACAKQWRFKPALSNNVRVARWVAIPIKFSLR